MNAVKLLKPVFFLTYMKVAFAQDHRNKLLMTRGLLPDYQAISSALLRRIAYNGPTKIEDFSPEEAAGHFLNGLARGLAIRGRCDRQDLVLDTIIVRPSSTGKGRFSGWFDGQPPGRHHVYIHRASATYGDNAAMLWGNVYSRHSRKSGILASKGKHIPAHVIRDSDRQLAELLPLYRIREEPVPLLKLLEKVGHDAILCRSIYDQNRRLESLFFRTQK